MVAKSSEIVGLGLHGSQGVGPTRLFHWILKSYIIASDWLLTRLVAPDWFADDMTYS